MSARRAKTISVLIVDGSAVVRSRLCALLAEHDHLRVVGEAGGAAEAWRLFLQHRPEAVLLDVRLPDSNGIELLSRIKQAAPSCLVVVLTNLRESVLRQESRRRGAAHFLHKASEFERVAELFRNHADQRNQSEPAWL
jgi:two-component system, NarL family, invasion response regulator UvrY